MHLTTFQSEFCKIAIKFLIGRKTTPLSKFYQCSNKKGEKSRNLSHNLLDKLFYRWKKRYPQYFWMRKAPLWPFCTYIGQYGFQLRIGHAVSLAQIAQRGAQLAMRPTASRLEMVFTLFDSGPSSGFVLHRIQCGRIWRAEQNHLTVHYRTE